ncbi:TRF2-interacting telomeric protein/Rap1 C terminal domain-containing protein [Daldinia vernicosa]|uniref:TRF2-interacting telomeric protein/Rap1 C terminal domain-containing protein n=1 Tax=Daldinia vernicosa TaxID=114800 RepID=UPI002008883D|nr:TRF2-interacting telomeric protein/Rap1 C terminal domain-containing protein [Daldinia vernicosa]KAI0851155.1 TRF2-interacting telomeric protein/Rap1 C terminal domain-containing protein [Daldinia vernicosa]
MSAPIVYEGTLARKNPSQNGLFSGKRFWVGHRVPSRLRFVQMIQNNGGQVVPLEKDADYLIADHAIKNTCLPGSYSYKWIDESCKDGVLKEPENYLCVPTKQSEPTKTGKPQPSGSAAPLKTRRTMFTAEDDRILRSWVASHARQGARIAGNTIYKELEEKYPHHTFQSWRDRWIKKLQSLPWLEEPDRTPSPPPTRRTSAHASPKTPGSLGRRVPTRNAAVTRERTEFTDEDDELLMQHVMDCVRQGKEITGVKIFRDLADDFPQHTAESWMTRWTEKLGPRFMIRPAEEEPEEEPEEELGEELEEPEEAVKAALDTRTEMEAEQPQDVLTPLKSSRIRSSTHSLHTVDEAPTAVTSPAEANVVKNKGKEHQILHTEVQTTPQAPAQESEEPADDSDQSFPNDISMKEQFLCDYQAYVEVEGLQFVPWVTIKGRTFELWDLWQAVASQKMDSSERDWQQIAERLGFDWVQHETIPDEIREYYEKYLAAFEEIWESFDADTADDSEDEEAEEDEEDSNARELLPSSPPIMPSLKRSFDAHRSPSDHTYPQPSPKRRRINRDAEIPSTPDHVNKTSDLRSQADNGTTPSTRRSTQRTAGERIEDNESRDAVPELPVFETQVNFEMESQCNITPSQQLHQESDAISLDPADASPTPKVRTRVTNRGTPTPKRLIRNPFQEDSDGEMTRPTTTSHSYDNSVRATVSGITKRRSLPKSYAQKSPPTSGASTSVVAPREDIQHSRLERSQLSRRLSSPKETPEDIIDRFCSLGYPRGIVLQSLRATTWRLGDAGHVMEILKRGEELPQRTHGVWTQRDDDALKLVTADEPPKDDKEKRKRIKARERLEKKHGPELMELRRKYLWEVV